CGADWNEQALKKATEYLSVMKLSRNVLIEHLISIEGFTREQAQYGAVNSY
ncbi:MAG: Ltp family lipoprotein, partial [Synergistaceae bacterium]|nr:Ltp family lipoprotein [Synergistaceae bacterium]